MNPCRTAALAFALASILPLEAQAAAPAAAGGATTLRAADTHPPDYPTVQSLVFLGQRLEELTGGRYRVQVFPSRQLGEERDTIAQTKSGAIDLNRVNLSQFTDTIPETAVLAFPFLFRSTAHMRRVLEGPVGTEVLGAFESHGLLGLAYYDSGARSFYTRGKPVARLADFQGMKFRVQQSQVFIAMVGALKAQGIALPYGQVLTAIETGLVDGAENNWASYESAGHFRAAPYYTLTEHTMIPEILFVSLERWRRLAPADRAHLRTAAQASAAHMRVLWEAREADIEARLKRGGVTVIRLSAEDRRALADATRPSYAPYLANPRVKALVERVRTTTP